MKGVPDLTLIGVPTGLQDRAPSVISFPQKFNKDTRVVWKEVMDDDKFKAGLSRLSVDQMWYECILEYLNRCEAQGFMPFSDTTQQEKNDAAISYLTSARIHLVKFVNSIGLFDKDKIRLYKAIRDYVPREYGFSIVQWAYSRPILDPTFESWLLQAPSPRFHRSTDMKVVKIIQPNVHLWVRYINSTRITVGYEINIGTAISVPGRRLPSRKDVEAFVDRVIWLPIVRSHRFKGVGGRLF
jgi:hypothetical protein